MGFVVAESFGCGCDFSNIGLPAIVSVEVEEGVEVFDLV